MLGPVAKSTPPSAPLEDDDEDEYETLILQNRNSLADVPPAWKIPRIGKAGALLRFHRVDSAVLTVEENTTPIGILLQS